MTLADPCLPEQLKLEQSEKSSAFLKSKATTGFVRQQKVSERVALQSQARETKEGIYCLTGRESQPHSQKTCQGIQRSDQGQG
jgi:hypothetical protein